MEAFLHRVTVTQRENLAASGVTEVLGFDENTVVLKTDQGLLTVHGNGLKLTKLSPEGGDVAITGRVDALVYEEPKKDSWLRRLFA